MGGSTALYCPLCRAEKRKEYDRAYKARKKIGRSIGLGETIGICAKCGEKFIYEGGLQKYCKSALIVQYARMIA